MKGNKMFKASIAAAMTVSMVGLQAPLAAEAAEGDFNLTIMHTNDTHANLENAPKRATLVKQLRAANPNSLLLDAGDVFSGSLYFNLFEGMADLELMNYMGYDAMTFGNHEFDLGSSEFGHQSLADFVTNAEFPFVSSNVDFSGDPLFTDLQKNVYTADFGKGEIYDGIIKTINGEKVGIFGLTTEETAQISSPDAIEFTNYLAAAEEAVAAFEAEGVNKIIALTHIGYNDSAQFDNDRLLAEGVAGIDVIVGGHTHTALTEGQVIDNNGEPVVIVQTGQYNSNLGQLDVTFNAEGVITSTVGETHPVTLHKVSDAAVDTEAAALLAPFKAEVDEVKNESAGAYTEVFLNGGRNEGGVRTSETNLGNVITDGMLNAAKQIDPDTVIALQNGGGIRSSIDVGEITIGEVLTVMPFGNSLAIMDLTGAELKTALEHSVKEFPKESGGFLHVAGMEFSFDPSQPVGSRVTSANLISEDGVRTKIENTTRYKVATNTFTAAGGDGYKVFADVYADGRVSEPGTIDYEMFIDYISELEVISPMLENRINPTIPFKDINMKDWEYPYVKDLYYRGIMNGTELDTFSPDQNLTRWQAVTILTRIPGLIDEEMVIEDSPFTDISHLPQVRQDEIHAAYAAGLIQGASATKFNPNANISRKHFALLINRVFENINGDFEYDENAPYKDTAKLTAEEQEAVTMLYYHSIATGYNGNFMPSKNATRAEAAKMFSLFMPYTAQ
ncbi:5'-nucleotidase C-terminal domain-containing protein [Planomicrobium okeanokoites]|uniref:5'-nucleotidase C-terminal domain-containing protein n=1 Tax=Planomicrobium okeanokoites TaxID=244 RepID=A0ABV7KT71_PLAOK|nr:5'-nucleotidase C-terminal domain-containing protein [Planomicrobium okeanokoites]TAA66234.1 multifunctional 2',3'-cyclic-nucleotide 2'-phosphodiesterase/5'-nucleotidase/3'-nucleotidase [Planomicrobium okeanokoites]